MLGLLVNVDAASSVSIRAASPLRAMLSTAGIVACEMSAGDCVEQRLECDGSWDRMRSVRLGLTGLITTGPLAHALFYSLERIAPGTTPIAVLRKVAMNAAVMPCMISATLGTAWLLEGRSPSMIADQLRRDLGSAVAGGLAFWPLANTFVYAAVAPKWRPAVSSGFGGLWGIYLSSCANALD